MIKKQIRNDIKNTVEVFEQNKKWCQLKKIEQVCVSNILRSLYIEFVLEKGRKPSKTEKEFIVACTYIETGEKEIGISVNELRKYFYSRIPKYDISIEKL